jgi:hypothetical protein
MPKCIYCNERDADSEEHSFPAALGMDSIKGFATLKGKLCKGCNGEIGKIEEQFLRCSLEAFFRYLLKIEGRKNHDKINPYHRGSSGGKPIKAEINTPDSLDIFLCEPANDSGDFTYSYQITLKDSDGNFHRIIVPDSVNSSESLDKLLASKEMSKLEFHSAIIDPDRKHIIEGISNLKGKSINWDDMPMEHHGKKELLITFEYTDKYFRAIAKIAFHYFLQYFEHYSGNEKEFEGIKAFIMQGGKVNEWVTIVPVSFIEDFKNRFISTNIYGHFVVAEDTGDRIFVKLGFFYGPTCLQDRHFEVQIGKAPGLIKKPKDIGHQILYFKEKDDDGYIGEMKELRKHSKRFLSSLFVPKVEYLGKIIRAIRRYT